MLYNSVERISIHFFLSFYIFILGFQHICQLQALYSLAWPVPSSVLAVLMILILSRHSWAGKIQHGPLTSLPPVEGLLNGLIIRGNGKCYHILLDIWPDPSNESLSFLALHTVILGHIAYESAELLLILSDSHSPLSKLIKLSLPAVVDSISKPSLIVQCWTREVRRAIRGYGFSRYLLPTWCCIQLVEGDSWSRGSTLCVTEAPRPWYDMERVEHSVPWENYKLQQYFYLFSRQEGVQHMNLKEQRE